MEDWRRILAQSVVKPKDLAERLGVDHKAIEEIVAAAESLCRSLRWL